MSKHKKKTSAPAASLTTERLQKVMAAAGIGSRRDCEELIVSGRVDVDGKVVTELGTRVDPEKQAVRVDGTNLPRPRRVYYIVNKPVGLLSTNADPAGRPRVIDMIDSKERLFTVGRLDKSSEGLLLVTNDGLLANRLTHPRYEIEKTYHVEVVGSPDADSIQKIRGGIHLAEAYVKPASIRVKRRLKNVTVLEMVLKEGRNREIRRVLARMGHKVVRLRRIGMGPLRLGEMPAGAYRPLTAPEVKALRKAANEVDAKPAPRGRRPGTSSDRLRRTGGTKPTGNRKSPRRTSKTKPPKRTSQSSGPPAKFKPEEFTIDSAELVGLDGGTPRRSRGTVIGEEGGPQKEKGRKKRPGQKKAAASTGKRRFGKSTKESGTGGQRSKTSKKKTAKGAKGSKPGGSRGKTSKKSTKGAKSTKAAGKRGAGRNQGTSAKGKATKGKAIKGKGAKKKSRKKHR